VRPGGRPVPHPPWIAPAAPLRRWRELGGGAFDGLAVLAAAVLVALGALNLDVVSGRPAALRQVALGGTGLILLLVFRLTRLGAPVVLGWVCYVVSVLLLGGVALDFCSVASPSSGSPPTGPDAGCRSAR
jgi:hypothetical protein